MHTCWTIRAPTEIHSPTAWVESVIRVGGSLGGKLSDTEPYQKQQRATANPRQSPVSLFRVLAVTAWAYTLNQYVGRFDSSSAHQTFPKHLQIELKSISAKWDAF